MKFFLTSVVCCALHAIASCGLIYFITVESARCFFNNPGNASFKGGADFYIHSFERAFDSLIPVQAVIFFSCHLAVVMVLRRRYVLAFVVSSISLLILDTFVDKARLFSCPDVIGAVKYAFPTLSCVLFLAATAILARIERKSGCTRDAREDAGRGSNRASAHPGFLTIAAAGLILAASFGISAIVAFSTSHLFPRRYGSGQSPLGILKAISAGQEQFRTEACVDADGDGVGEYGFLAELSGSRKCRVSGIDVSRSPYIPSIQNKEIYQLSEYLFAVFLCDSDSYQSGTNIFGSETGISARQADVNENTYICIAWPLKAGITGWRVYAISPDGTVMQNPNSGPNRVSGHDNPPLWSAAMAGAANWKTGHFVRAGEQGQDPDLQEPWTPIG